MRNKSKNVLLLIVVLAVIGIGVGYAALTQKLTLNGTTTTKAASDWDVKIASISSTNSATGTANVKSAVNSDGISGTFSADLLPGGTVTYTVTTTNAGSIKASAGAPQISYEGDNSDFISCTVIPNEENAATIAGNATHTYTVTMAYVGDKLPEAAVTEKVIITFPYSQAE